MITVFAFFAVACTLCVALRRRFEWVLAPAILAAMAVLTALAMLGRLLWVDALGAVALVVCVGLTAWSLLSKRRSLAELGRDFARFVLTPSFVCFVAVTAYYWYASEPMVVWWKDDVVQWALQPKSLWVYNGLVDGARHLDLFFATYTPGMQVLQWWLLHVVGEWREGVLYFVLFTTYAAFLLPLLSRVRWRRAYVMPVMAVGLIAFPVWGNVVSYSFLGVDTALAFCFGYVLVRIFTLKPDDRLGLLGVALGLCGLVLIKQVGLLLAAMAVLLMLVLRRNRGQKRLACLLTMLSPLIVWGAWTAYCHAMGLTGYHTSNVAAYLKAMLDGSYVAPEGASGVADAFAHALTASANDEILYYTHAAVEIPKALWLALLCALPLLCARLHPKGEMKRVALYCAAMTVLYLLIQYASFFTVFYDETVVYTGAYRDNMILLLERYLAPITLGFGMLGLWLILDAWPRGLATVWKPLPALVAAALTLALALTVNWALMREGMLPKRYFQQERSVSVETDVKMDHDWGEAIENPYDATVLVGFSETSDYIKNLRYVYAPARFLLPERSFCETSAQLAQYLIEHHVTYVICFDDTSLLYAPACELSEDGDMYSFTLYEVREEDGQVSLAEYY